jgi:hypothetical protein
MSLICWITGDLLRRAISACEGESRRPDLNR